MAYSFIKKTIFTNDYGKLDVAIGDKTKIGNGYFVSTNYKNKKLSGFIDIDGNEIISFQNMKLLYKYISKDKKNVCLGFIKDNKKVFYHLRMDKNSVKLVFDTVGITKNNLDMYNVDDSLNYWVIEVNDGEREKYALYDYNKGCMVSTFFDGLKFIKNPINNHDIFYTIDICNEEYEPYSYKIICGYLDNDANLSSDIYDTDECCIYNAKKYGPDTLSGDFVGLIGAVEKSYLNNCMIKEDEINRRITYLNDNNYIELAKGPKVIKFDKDRKKV